MNHHYTSVTMDEIIIVECENSYFSMERKKTQAMRCEPFVVKMSNKPFTKALRNIIDLNFGKKLARMEMSG